MKNKILVLGMAMMMLLTAVSCNTNADGTAGTTGTLQESAASPESPPPLDSPAPSVPPEETAVPSLPPELSLHPSIAPSSGQTPKPEALTERKDKQADFIKKTKALKSGAVVDVKGMDKKTLEACFFYVLIPDSVFERMKGKSFKEDCTTKRSDLRYVKVLYYGFDKKTHVGELVVNKALARDFIHIFRDLYNAKYPIEKMRLVDDYNADDDASMANNNTSCFNFRRVEGSKTLSQHAYGRAVDINPFYNPYVVTIKGKRKVEPPGSEKYLDRTLKLPYIIKKDDVCYKAFKKRGFSWGGTWKPDPDYQHFAKKK